MRTSLLILMVAALMAVTPVLAQPVVGSGGSGFYVAASLGLDFLGSPEFELGLAFGLNNFITSGIDLRGDFAYGFGNSNLVLFGASAIATLDIGTTFTPYVGAGPRLIFSNNVIDGNKTSLGLGFLGGAEYDISNDFALFAEFRSNITFGGGSFSGVGFGGKYNF